MKISVIGVGAVGATCAEECVKRALASDLVLLDVKEGAAEGKALDLFQATAHSGKNVRIKGVTNDYQSVKDSDLVVITSGIPRKPGMTREELIGTNAHIIRTVCDNVLQQAPKALFIVVSNPVDTLAYLALQHMGIAKQRVIGLGGALDSARFKSYLSRALGAPMSDLQAMVIGGHGDTTMIPLIQKAYYQCVLVTDLLDKATCDKIVQDTMVGGATLTKYLGTSAWYGPGAAVANMAASLLRDEKRVIPCSVYLEGEYGEKDIFMGVPAVLGKEGVEKIIPLSLNESEKQCFRASAQSVRKTNEVLKTLG